MSNNINVRIILSLTIAAVILSAIVPASVSASYTFAYSQRSLINGNSNNAQWTQTQSETVYPHQGEHLEVNNYWYNNRPGVTATPVVVMHDNTDPYWIQSHTGSTNIAYGQGLLEWANEAPVLGNVGYLNTLYTWHNYDYSGCYGTGDSNAKKYQVTR